WDDAEATLLAALDPTASGSIGHRADTAVRLAELRLWQGRIEEAAALLSPYEDRVGACLALARLHFANGDCDLAAAVIKRATRDLVGDRLRTGELEGLLVEVELSRGDLAAAGAAAERLATLAEPADAPVLNAEASLAAGRVALAR